MSEEKLKPCPFCGGEATANESSWRSWWHVWVICKNCGATIDKPTKEETIEAWNRRVPQRTWTQKVYDSFEKVRDKE